jgi:hypothetical protein
VNYRNAANEALFAYSCSFNVVAILQTIMQAGTFRPTDQEIAQATAAVLRACHNMFIPILAKPPTLRLERIASAGRQRTESIREQKGDAR